MNKRPNKNLVLLPDWVRKSIKGVRQVDSWKVFLNEFVYAFSINNTSDVHMDFGNTVHDCRIGAAQILAVWLYRCLKQYLIGKSNHAPYQ